MTDEERAAWRALELAALEAEERARAKRLGTMLRDAIDDAARRMVAKHLRDQ
jgi:hypothetical protein